MSETKKVLFSKDGELVEKELIEFQDGFDGQTGEPVIKYKLQDGFDGQTGEPVYVIVEKTGSKDDKDIYEAASTKSDKIKEEPLQKEEQEESKEADKEESKDTDTTDIVAVKVDEKEDEAREVEGLTPGGLLKKPLAKVVAFIIAAVLAAMIVCTVLASGMFLSKHDRILKACYDTAKDDVIASTLIDACKVLDNNELTVDYDGKVSYRGYSGSASGSYSQDITAGKYSLDTELNIAGLAKESVQLYVDDSIIQVAAPELLDSVFQYDYTKSSDGFIAEYVEKETIGTIDDVNTLIMAFSELSKSSPECRKKVIKNEYKVFKKLKIDKLDARKYQIDDKDRKCKGYRIKLDDDDIEAFAEAYVDAVDEVAGNNVNVAMEAMYDLGISQDEYDKDELVSELMDMAEMFEDTEISFYLYKGKLAAVIFDMDDGELEIEFKGGDTRCSNVKITGKFGKLGKTSLKKKSTYSGGVEEGKIVADGAELLGYSYNKKSGEFVIKALGEKLKGTILVKGNDIELEYKGNAEGVDLNFTADISKGARIKKLSGDIEDIGDMEQEDFYEIFTDAQSIVNGLSFF